MARERWQPCALTGEVEHLVDHDGVWYVHAPGNTYCAACWPPRGRGRGESLSSPRRIEAMYRALKVLTLRTEGMRWATIATLTGYRSKSGAYMAYQRILERTRS